VDSLTVEDAVFLGAGDGSGQPALRAAGAAVVVRRSRAELGPGRRLVDPEEVASLSVDEATTVADTGGPGWPAVVVTSSAAVRAALGIGTG
jgi:hypothetical protein